MWGGRWGLGGRRPSVVLVHLWEKTNQLTFQDRLLRFPDFQLSFFFCEICLKNMLVRYRGINNKGVLERPGTKWMVLRAISSTLKCQFTGKCWKVDFLMPCKPNRAKMCCAVFVRSVRSPWTPPDLANFNLNYEKTSFGEKLDFSVFSSFVFCQCRDSRACF